GGDAGGAGDKPGLGPRGSAVDRFAHAADETGQRIDALLASDSPSHAAAPALDSVLMKTERAFLDQAGIPGRPWYRHLIYAPQPTYAAEVLPGVAEALERNDRAQLDRQVAALVAVLNRAAAVLAPR